MDQKPAATPELSAEETQKPTRLPEPRSPKTSSWKKFEERQTQKLLEEKQKQLLKEQQEKAKKEQETKQKQLYGYVPFKAPPTPIYEVRPQAKASLVNSVSISRPGAAMGNGNQPNVHFRPPSEMGTYRPASRFQSFTTLPRPDYLDVESLYGPPPPQPYLHEHNHSIDAARPGSKLSFAYEYKRPASAMSGIQIQPPFIVTNSKYPVDECQIPTKEIVSWDALRLSSCLQILFGMAIFAVGASRMLMRAEYAKGQELFYGISVMVAGIFGYFSSRSQSFTMVMWYFAHSLMNAIFAFVPLFSGMVPLLQIYNNGGNRAVGTATEPIEVDFSLIILSGVEFAAALVVSLYGCRTLGRTIHAVVQIRNRLLRMEGL
ncbi:unnamed protein product [Bursaphelenchus okinawaensis]|uniref:Uncharacterized protein n=1 Tax=Bursaphelenchus okinawaensis TaxID=465554 RepID=A0A811L6B5_9BILA|nr:unnamed protein product [Bursaphelenchus okinawaensis]CAG9118740.1 unnamed protein product [Bursaphelenchus okinawaensis]